MHVLVVLDHPDPASFTAAAAAAFQQGAQAAGHTVELADLNAEGFDPRWTLDDNRDDAAPDDVLREQARIAHADAICLAFPLFWWGMPATMKGWVDRVWSWGWAYDQLDDPEVSLQKPRSGVLLIPAGARSDEMEESGYRQALQTAWIDGTFGYFGFTRREMVLLNGSTGSAPRRRALLERAHDAGRALQPPGQGAPAGLPQS
ncbi:MAG: NAD(P)H-dependent oxidoreductase [Pseudomonadota bacterium]